MILKIISGGQTGADQAALDAAIITGTPYGGWVPEGRMTEKGPLSEKYQMEEMIGCGYSERTEKNILDSDGTVIISYGKLAGGSGYTMAVAKKNKRPCLHIDLNNQGMSGAVENILSWLRKYMIQVLNVAGPRASKDGKIYKAVFNLMEEVINVDRF